MNLDFDLFLDLIDELEENEELFDDSTDDLDLSVKRVVFSTAKDGNPLTIVLWNDGDKTMTKCHAEDTYNKELGVMLCACKKALPSSIYHSYCEMLESDDPVSNAKDFIVNNIEFLEGVSQTDVNNFLKALKSDNRYLETARLIAQYVTPDYQYLKRQARKK